MITLLIARHGNTFNKGDLLCRVGLRTDLPLSASGIEQTILLGEYLHQYYPKVDRIICSELQRTQQTATNILKSYTQPHPTIQINSMLNEVDYGDDDGKPEEEVIQRIGKDAIRAWDNAALLPSGWELDIEGLASKFSHFTDNLAESNLPQTYLLITSNGIARFLPQFLNLLPNFNEHFNIKLPTAGLGILTYQQNSWHCHKWGKVI